MAIDDLITLEVSRLQLRTIRQALVVMETQAVRKSKNPSAPGAIAARRAAQAVDHALQRGKPSVPATRGGGLDEAFRRLRRRSSDNKAPGAEPKTDNR